MMAMWAFLRSMCSRSIISMAAQAVAHGTLADLGLGANALAYLLGTLEELVQTGGEFLIAVAGCRIGLLDLSLHGSLAHDGTLQAAHHTEEVAGHAVGNLAVAVIELYAVAGLQQHRRAYGLAVELLEIGFALGKRCVLMIDGLILYHTVQLVSFIQFTRNFTLSKGVSASTPWPRLTIQRRCSRKKGL